MSITIAHKDEYLFQQILTTIQGDIEQNVRGLQEEAEQKFHEDFSAIVQKALADHALQISSHFEIRRAGDRLIIEVIGKESEPS